MSREKRKWITRRQIAESIREGDLLRRIRRQAGLPTTHITIKSYGSPVGQYVAAFAQTNGLSTKQAESSLRARRHQENQRRSAGRISVAEWNHLAVV